MEVQPWSRESGADAATRLLPRVGEFDSLIVHGDWATLGVMETLQAAGARIPKDIAIVMYDNFRWVEMIKPQPTAVGQPFQEQAYEAFKMLMELADGPANSVRMKVLQPALIIRESCGAIPPRTPPAYKGGHDEK